MRGAVWIRTGPLLVALVVCSAKAGAHPLVEAGREQLDQAALAAAIEAFTRAEDATDLSAAELETVLELRALAWLGLGDAAASNRELLCLASIAPEHETPDGRRPRGDARRLDHPRGRGLGRSRWHGAAADAVRTGDRWRVA